MTDPHDARTADRTAFWRAVALAIAGLVVALYGAGEVEQGAAWAWAPAILGFVSFAWGMSDLRQRASRGLRRRP